MFEEFLIQYIKDYISCADVDYIIDDEDIKRIAKELSCNDHLWNIMDNFVSYELEDYKKKEEGEDNAV